jgi:hypothetical protein
MSNIDFSILLHSIFGMNRYEVSRFGESIYDYPNRIELAGGHR